MAEKVSKVVKCGQCGDILNEASDTLGERYCRKCGSQARQFDILITESLQLHSQIGIKARHGEIGRPYLESKVGDDFHQKTGEWNRLERVVDRENDKYTELITNPRTGEVIHYCEEPLSQHMGHGSAKEKTMDGEDG